MRYFLPGRAGLAGPGCGEEPCAVVVPSGGALVAPSAGGLLLAGMLIPSTGLPAAVSVRPAAGA